MKKALVSVLLALAVIFCATGCNGSAEYNGWTITRRTNGDGEAMEYYAVINIKENKGGAVLRENEIYLNVDGFKDSVTVDIVFSNSSTISTSKQITTTITKNGAVTGDGWYKVEELTESVSYSYMEVVVKDSMNFNEIAVLNESGELLKLDLVRCGERPKRNSASVSWEYTKAQLQAKVDSGELTHTALNLIDEQNRFKK
ncbi:MAG: hypothetical protein ACI4M6_01610 [Christensenellaceae bacterium]